jgi:hypothetical protein
MSGIPYERAIRQRVDERFCDLAKSHPKPPALAKLVPAM